MHGHLRNIAIQDLCRCPIQLYPVRKETVDYYMLRDSIGDVGVLQPILVRPISGGHEVVCGVEEFECAKDLRFESVPCLIQDMSDSDVLRIQMIHEADRAGQINCIRRLNRIMGSYDTVEELAFAIHKHPDWVRRLLRLNNLSPNWKHANLKVATELALLPIHKQDEFLGLGDELPESEFVEVVRSYVREMRTVNKQSSKTTLKPYPRKMGVLEDELENQTNAATVLMRADAQTALDGWNAAIAWVICMDDYTVAERVARSKRAQNLEARREQQRILELSLRRTYEQRTCDTDDPSDVPAQD